MESSGRIKYFLFSQHLADGIRVTLAILLPALLGHSSGNLHDGISMSLGALAISITDGPGPVKHKRNSMFHGILLIGLITLVTGLLNHSAVSLGLWIGFSVFFFSMFNIYGNRVASVGTAALLVMALRMAEIQPVSEILTDTMFVTAGGAWYMAMSMAFYILVPFRPIQRALGECISETAAYMHIRSQLYDEHYEVDEVYERLIHKQSAVSDQQNEVRELLFRNRSILKESTHEGRKLVVTFAASVDLFEQIMATWYDYKDLRTKYGNTGILNKISNILKALSNEIAFMGEALHSQTTYTPQLQLIPELDRIKQETETATGKPLDFTLRKILINIRSLGENIDRMGLYFSATKKNFKHNLTEKEYLRFVAHQKISLAVFKNNLSLDSSAFRHSLRVAITCVAGYLLSKFYFRGDQSYWIIMTIIIIMKPAYSLTKARNKDRLLGTIAGALVGLLILFLVKDDKVLFALMALFMLGTYTFIRYSYITMVICLTPFVLILFHFLGLDIISIAGERTVDTAVASVLAWGGTRFLFPRWEAQTIIQNLTRVLKANRRYLFRLREHVCGQEYSQVEYKLERKEVFVATANLSAALHRMQSEPHSKQKHKVELYELVVLNHVLSSNIASALSEWKDMSRIPSHASQTDLKKSLENMATSIQFFESSFDGTLPHQQMGANKETSDNDSGSFRFIRKITSDIRRLSSRINN